MFCKIAPLPVTESPMLDTLFAHLALHELAVRMGCTALVVMVVAWAAGRFGPVVGGALAGLPIVLGPGFFFLLYSGQPGFAAQSAAYALLSLSAGQSFLLAYIVAARRLGAWGSLAVAVGVWLVAAWLLRQLPGLLWLGLLLYGLTVLVYRRLGWRFVQAVAAGKGRTGWGLLLLRGALAGLLVAGVSAAAAWLGAGWAGMLMAFPIGYSVVSVTVHQNLGPAHVTAMLYTALLGSASLAGFCAVLAYGLPRLPAWLAFLAAVLLAVLVTLGLLLTGKISSTRLGPPTARA